MNRYGRMALDHNQTHRPVSFATIPDPEKFFEEAGEMIAAEVTAIRDELLGPIRPAENPEDYRLRSYQALTTAEELTLTDHPLFQPEPEPGETEEDPDLETARHRLDEINRAINTPM